MNRLRLVAFGLLALLAGCGPSTPPSAQDIAGKSPVGSIRMFQHVAGGKITGDGSLSYGGITYSFKLTGTVDGNVPRSGDIVGEGEVYGINQLTDFTGRFAQANGALRMDGSGSNTLWMRNGTNVVIRLRSKDGMVLPRIGNDVVYIPQLN